MGPLVTSSSQASLISSRRMGLWRAGRKLLTAVPRLQHSWVEKKFAGDCLRRYCDRLRFDMSHGLFAGDFRSQPASVAWRRSALGMQLLEKPTSCPSLRKRIVQTCRNRRAADSETVVVHNGHFRSRRFVSSFNERQFARFAPINRCHSTMNLRNDSRVSSSVWGLRSDLWEIDGSG
jgi:hypothetical protein